MILLWTYLDSQGKGKTAAAVGFFGSLFGPLFGGPVFGERQHLEIADGEEDVTG